jgi:tetratricopeptide (TPR) repeat protein
MLAFDRAITTDPNNSYAWLDIARFRRSIGDMGPALFATDKAVAANPRHAAALVMRGELSREQYGLAAAIPWFDRALEVDAANLPALLGRASTFGDMGRMTAMLADARAASAIDPFHPLPISCRRPWRRAAATSRWPAACWTAPAMLMRICPPGCCCAASSLSRARIMRVRRSG